MLQQITAPYRNQTLKLINSEDVLKGVLFYKTKKKGDFTVYYLHDDWGLLSVECLLICKTKKKKNNHFQHTPS